VSSGWFINTVEFPLRISKHRFCCRFCKVLFAKAFNTGRKKPDFSSAQPAACWALLESCLGDIYGGCENPLCHWSESGFLSHAWLLHRWFINAALIMVFSAR